MATHTHTKNTQRVLTTHIFRRYSRSSCQVDGANSRTEASKQKQRTNSVSLISAPCHRQRENLSARLPLRSVRKISHVVLILRATTFPSLFSRAGSRNIYILMSRSRLMKILWQRTTWNYHPRSDFKATPRSDPVAKRFYDLSLPGREMSWEMSTIKN